MRLRARARHRKSLEAEKKRRELFAAFLPRSFSSPVRLRADKSRAKRKIRIVGLKEAARSPTLFRCTLPSISSTLDQTSERKERAKK